MDLHDLPNSHGRDGLEHLRDASRSSGSSARRGLAPIAITPLARFVAWTGLCLASLAVAILGTPSMPVASADTTPPALSVNLAQPTGAPNRAGLGILYGISEDGSQPGAQYLQPLDLNAFRGGGWFSGGWIGDNYTYGPDMQADIASIIAQAQQLEKVSGPHFQYQVLLSDLYGANAGEPANTIWPCTGGDCSNYLTFLTDSINALKASGINFAFDIWNEPEFSFFWGPGVNTPQYFEMWDTAYRTIRSLDPTATIVGPSFAYTPSQTPSDWLAFLGHVKAAHTVPNMISNHEEGDGDDPVVDGQAIESDLKSLGMRPLPLSANEYQPADAQTAGVTAWYLDRLQQSAYTNAMRGNWSCCEIPNLTGLLTDAASGWAPTGNWWAMRTYAEMTGRAVSTSGEVGTTAVSTTEDLLHDRAITLVGDQEGYAGPATITFTGLSSVKWLQRNGNVHVTIYRIPDQGPLYAEQVVYDQSLSAATGSVTVPFTFQSANDAFAIYLSWDDPQTVTLQAPPELTPGQSYQVPVTLTNDSAVTDLLPAISLSVSTANPSDAAQVQITCTSDDASTCPLLITLPPGESATATYTVDVPSTAPQVAYRLTGAATAATFVGPVTVQNSTDVVVPCELGTVCEAENGTLSGGACFANDHVGYTGNGFVACMTSPGPGISQEFDVPSAGTYTFDVRYSAGPNGPSGTRTATVSLNGASQGQIQMPETGSWDTWTDATISVQLPAGLSTIEFSIGPTDTGWYNVDHFVLSQPSSS